MTLELTRDEINRVMARTPPTESELLRKLRTALTVSDEPPMGGLTVREIRTAYDRHFKKNGMSFDSVVQQLIGSSEKIDWDRFRSNHPIYCDYWDRNDWRFCTEYFLGWVNGGCCQPPPEPKQQVNSRRLRLSEL